MSAADRNLLFGVFALQMDFLTRDQLVEGMQAWVLEKSRPLEEILVERSLLAAADRDFLLPLVARHLEQHGGDPERSLKAISSVTASVEVLKQIDDGDLQHSLASLKLRELASDDDIPATVSYKPDFGQSGTRYLSLRPHAKGGLGEVFVARDTELDREVALKEIQQHHAHDADSRSRFLMEAEITGKLEHPGIGPVYGLGSYPDGRPFYAMRFIRGDSLHHAIQDFHKHPPTGNPYESVAFRKLLGRFVDVCNAVGYAHSRGVLHRDLKPGNVMLGKHGETLVVDWGLAKVKGREETVSDGDATLLVSSGSGTDQTLPGSAIGTPGYMSPEQAEGKLSLLGPATDIYGLGATLYTLLTGQRPIEAETVHEALRRTVQGDVPKPGELNTRIPKPLEAICLKAMALSPKLRYATCGALADDVDRFLGDEPVTAHREPLSARVARFTRKHRGVVQASAAALVLIAVLAVGAAFLIDEQRQAAVQAKTEEEEQRIKAEQLAGENSELAFQEAEQRTIAETKRQEAEDLAAKLQTSLTETEKAKQQESTQRALADAKRIEAERKLYLSQIYRAAGDLEAGRHGQASSILATIPFEQRQWEARYLARQAEGTPLTLRGHGSNVTSVGFSPDGRRIVSGSGDKTVKVWDARTPDDDPNYAPWAEDAARRKVWDAIYHGTDANAAIAAKNWFAAHFHLEALLKLEQQALRNHEERQRSSARERLMALQSDPSLSAVRDAENLKLLTAEERASFQAFWRKLESVLPAVAESRIRLKDSSFEEPTDKLMVWTIHSWANQSDVCKKVQGEGRSASTALRITSTKSDDIHCGQKVMVKPRTRYRMSGWVKTENVKIEKDGNWGTGLAVWGDFTRSQSLEGTRDWTFVFFEFDSQERTTLTIGPRLGHHGSRATGIVWFDDLQLMELP